MKRFFATLPLIAVLAFPAPSAAQISAEQVADGDVNHVEFLRQWRGGFVRRYSICRSIEFAVTGPKIPGTAYNGLLVCRQPELHQLGVTGPYDARFTSG